MHLTEKQKKVVDFALKNGGEVTKKQAMELINTHYHNGDKHVGEALSRMVKAGLLIRIKPGYFKLGEGCRKKSEPIIENQITIF